MHKATSGLAALLLIGMAGCVDLDVQNPNAPDAERALATPEDTEALIAGGYTTWANVLWYDGPTMGLSNVAFEHQAPWANQGMEFFARIPRVPHANVAGGRDVPVLTWAWEQSYAAINQVSSGLYAIDAGDVDLGTEGNLRARAFGKYVLGLAHGTVAMLYDSGFIFDETAECLTDKSCGSDPADVPLQGHQAVMTAALGYFAEAATLSAGATFTIPATWMGQDVSPATLIQLAHSERARMRAGVARTPAERAAVDWDAVRTDAGLGVSADWDFVSDCVVLCDEALYYRNYPGWHMMSMFIIGMADVTGAYQTWMAVPHLSKREFIMQTPDTRFPQGATEAAQIAAPGSMFIIAQGGSRLIGSRPDRGTWRWSYYRNDVFTTSASNFEGADPMYTAKEMDALIAEADYRDGLYGAVETFVNSTRTLHGLNATNSGTAAGVNTSAVPRLPNNTVGDLWEMFKWEKRLETHEMGFLRIGWYFDGRGWGDLMEGSFYQIPVPFREMQLLQQQPYNFGGVGGNSAAPVGTYGY
ncbi:MAG: hypothetical protein JSW43_02080 [Gemmatimonadota bacterium]|nr:MAG: hypothetical protein JSW43_02080 [Gemmatimonadota bacterium]